MEIQPRWLKLIDAARYAAMGKHRLIALARDPDSPVIGYQDPDSKRGDWIFDRRSLDRYREDQVKAQCEFHEVIENVAERLGL